MHILDLVDKNNLAPDLTKEQLSKIGSDVVTDYDVDFASMKDWRERNKLALDLINMKPEVKTQPWQGAANTKLPLVLNAAMKASAEEYAEILRGSELVKTELFGAKSEDKVKRGQRVSKRMNFQFYHELDEWTEDHDKLILAKNIVGTVHKKFFFADGKIQCVLRRSGVVINDNVEKIKDAPRITDEIDKFWWEAEEKFRSKEWTRIDLTNEKDKSFAEGDKVNEFLEQIRREDLDDDGYPEPYVVTVHRKTKQVVRIAPNYTLESVDFADKDGVKAEFDPYDYRQLDEASKSEVKRMISVVRINIDKARIRYIKYEMIPSWEGGYWGFGYGILLGPLNENCNQVINHLLNAGHLANQGGGFINSGIKIKGGELKFRMNEWKSVQSTGGDLARNIVPMPVKEPSQTLFSLLGLLMQTLRELSSVTEVMSGEQPRANMPAASVLALIEQGKKLFNSVYKRHYQSLSKEMLALFDLNFIYEDPKDYIEFHDLQQMPVPTGIPPAQFYTALVHGDFERKGMDVLPTANPEFSSRVQRMAEAQAMLELKDDPRVDGGQVLRRYMSAIIDDQDEVDLLVPKAPQLTPLQIMEQIDLKTKEFLAGNEARKSEAEAKKAEVELQKAMLDAEKMGIKIPMDLEKAKLSNIKAALNVENTVEQGELIKLQQEATRKQSAESANENDKGSGA